MSNLSLTKNQAIIRCSRLEKEIAALYAKVAALKREAALMALALSEVSVQDGERLGPITMTYPKIWFNRHAEALRLADKIVAAHQTERGKNDD